MKPSIFIAFTYNKSSVSDYFTALSNKFYQQGYKVVVFTKQRNRIDELAAGIDINFWPSKRPTGYKDFYLAYTKMKKHKPIMTISAFGSVNIFMLASYLSNVRFRIAWIRTLSTQYFEQDRFLIFRKSLIYKLATNIITNSIATKKDTILVYRLKERNIKVLPNSVKNYHLYDNNLHFKKNKLVLVGRLDPSKGIDTLLVAVRILVDRNFVVTLEIFGSGNQERELKELVKNLKLTHHVIFVGNRPKEEVLHAFKTSHCAVVPSKSEAFGFVVIEAMSVGGCVVAANNTGIMEIVVDKQTGLLFETGNPNDLAEKIEIILSDIDYRNKLAANGYNRFLNLYETENSVNRDFTYFKNLIE